MKTLHIIVYAVVVFLIAGAAISYIRANAPDNATGSGQPSFVTDNKGDAEQIQEDDPGWDCYVDGNGICGGDVQDAIESDSTFAEYDRAFDCFAEAHYTDPSMSWDDRVARCAVPDSSP